MPKDLYSVITKSPLMICEIGIPNQEYKNKKEDGESQELSNLKKVNVFVGPNNSGKSRFMRSLLTNNLKYSRFDDHQTFIEAIRDIREKMKNYFHQKGIAGNHVMREIEDLEKQTENKNHQDFDLAIYNFFARVEELIRHKKAATNEITGSVSSPEIGQMLEQVYSNATQGIEEDAIEKLNPPQLKLVYVPILRGLRRLVNIKDSNGEIHEKHNSGVNDLYKTRALIDYFNKDESGRFEIFTGLTLYEDIKNMLLGSLEERNFIRDFELFLQNNFFKGKEITLIPNVSSDVLYVRIGEEEKPIYDLGDGIQTIIIGTFPIFKYQDERLLLFVEEPESNLHPSIQRKLLETYCDTEKFSNCQVFMTTHSNHFLDLTLDFSESVSVFSFQKTNDGDFSIEYTTPNKKILDLLGVRNSSVFLSNCIIWVEGISDRLYIKKFLQLYINSLKERSFTPEEDKHYSVIEYGGDNISHFNFTDDGGDEERINIQGIQKNNFLVMDNDGESNFEGEIVVSDSGKTKLLKNFKKIFRGNMFAEHREIENLIPFSIYKNYFESLPASQTRKWEYDATMSDEGGFNTEIKDKPVGEVMRTHFIKLKQGENSESFNNQDIKCIGSSKKKIATELIKAMDKLEINFEALPEETRDLTKNIYQFILSSNT